MPGEHSFGFDYDEGRAPLSPEVGKPNPEESVSCSKSGAIDGTAQYDDLLS